LLWNASRREYRLAVDMALTAVQDSLLPGLQTHKPLLDASDDGNLTTLVQAAGLVGRETLHISPVSVYEI